MKFQPNKVYCLHNTGNNFETIFFSHRNRKYFRKKIRIFIDPFAEVLHVSLLENQFAILIKTKDEIDLGLFSKNIGIMLSSYTRGVNKEQGRLGSLFRRGTKAFKSFSEFPKYLKDKMEAFRHFFDPSRIVNFPLTVKKFYTAVVNSLKDKTKLNNKGNDKKKDNQYAELKLNEILIHPSTRYRSSPKEEECGNHHIAPG